MAKNLNKSQHLNYEAFVQLVHRLANLLKHRLRECVACPQPGHFLYALVVTSSPQPGHTLVLTAVLLPELGFHLHRRFELCPVNFAGFGVLCPL